ncbi:MAG: peptidylprolyl isomerase [Phycisphaerae bacterium]
MPPRLSGWHLFLVLPVLIGGCILAPVLSGSAHLDVSAGTDQTVEMGQNATLSAKVGEQTEGFAFRWEQQTGPASDVPLADATRAETEAGPFDTLGDYKFRVLAATEDGRFGQDFVVITVVEPSQEDNPDDMATDGGTDGTGDTSTDGPDDTSTDGPDDTSTDGPDDTSTDGPPDDTTDPTVDPDTILTRINAPLNLPVALAGQMSASLPPGSLAATYQWEVLAGDATIESPTERETNITANSEGNVTVRVTMTVPELNRDFTDELDINVEPEGTFRIIISGQSQGIAGTVFDFRSTFGNPPPDGILSQWEVIQGEGTFASPNVPEPIFTPTSEGIVVVQVTARVPSLGDLQAVDDFVLVVFPNTDVGLSVPANNLAVVGEPASIPATTQLFRPDELDFQWEIVSGDVTLDDPTSANPQIVINSLETAELNVSASATINDILRSGSATVFLTGVPDLNPRVDIQVTDFGTVTLELDGQAAPQTVANLLHYVDSGYYDGLVFHRNSCIDNADTGECVPFVVQGGGFRVVDGELERQTQGLRDPVPSEAPNDLTNSELYSISMALAGGDANSATTEFFVNLQDNGFLDGQNFTVFGRVAAESIPVVDAIAATDRVENTVLGGEVSRPVPDVIMEQVRRAP